MKLRNCLFVLTVLLYAQAAAAPPARTLRMTQPVKYEERKYSFSLAGGFGYSFFGVDKRHSERASSLLGMTGMFRFHFFASPNVHIQLGLEVLSQKAKFETYYFADGHSQFYDRSFGYTHRMRSYELYVPIMARIGTNAQEANARSIFYFLAGYSPKMFLSASTVITQDATGRDVWGGSTELTFENWIFNEQTNSVALIGIGLDKRFGWENKFLSFELLYRYNFSRFHYNGNITTNDLMIRNSCVTFQVGYRFQ